MKRFVIIGLPRSGTTYLQTLLNSDPRVLCRGESFDPWQIDDNGAKTKDLESIVARDADPGAFFDERLSLGTRDGKPLSAIGLKILFQHNPRLLAQVLPDRADVALVFVHRANKLAQFASMRHTEMTKEWTRTNAGGLPPKLKADVRWISSQCNTLENQDFLLHHYLKSLPNPLLSVEYRGMFSPAFHTALFAHLGLKAPKGLSSPLRKQGNNTVVERFENAAAVSDYMCRTGRGDWLGAELDAP